MEKAYYNYAITGFKVNSNNADIIDIEYGKSKFPLKIFKKDANRLIKAILPPAERKVRGISDDIDGDVVERLNILLKGRAMVLITNCENYLEYCNGGQNGVEKITGINISGEFNTPAFDYKSLSPAFEDLYPDLKSFSAE